VSNTVLVDSDGATYVDTELVDVSEEMAAHEALRTREQLLERLTEALPSGVVQIDESGRIVHKNERTNLLVGNADATTLEEQLSWCRPDDAARLTLARTQVLADGKDVDLELQLDAPGDPLPQVCHVALRALTDEHGQVVGAIVAISDITHSSVLRDQLTVRATFDDLTGCHNRASVISLLESALADRVAASGVAVVFVDLDGFKPVNDRYGHAAGDDVLTVAADRLRSASRTGDLVGRLGGDEFLVICPALPGPEDALMIARRIADRMREPIVIGGAALAVSASVGVAWSADLSVGADALIARADAAMYESKVEGAGRPVARDAA
jgi:diguanylate cyclase (GGDEF)-like protein